MRRGAAPSLILFFELHVPRKDLERGPGHPDAPCSMAMPVIDERK
jgi:hypothetical protein